MGAIDKDRLVLQAYYLTALHRINTLVAYRPFFKGNHVEAARLLLDYW